MKITSPAQLTKLRKNLVETEKKHTKKIMVCCGPGCLANGAAKIVEEFRKVLKKKRIKGFKIEALKETGCHGFCDQGPLVVIEPKGTFYAKVKPKDVESIIDASIKKDDTVKKLLYDDPGNGHKIQDYKKIPFYSHQQRIALRNLGHIDQYKIEDYIANGGYKALTKALTKMKPDDIVDEVSKSGLRGRGGAGFPAGRKWATCAKSDDTPHYVICNGDEGDPGAFMDRSIMEGDPHSVLEGMIIAAYAVGAHEGYIYVREEYPLAVENLQLAINQATEHGFLGENILGTDYNFELKISRGGGAFVCGESSALMKSVAGEVGEPRAKYVRSVLKGLFDKPTVLNNVESYANVPVIIDKGSKWFAGIGTKKSTGTKAFSLVGKVRNTGLIEVPMGTTLREIIYDIGGGIIDDRPFKAVQTGGPSGGCLPEDKLDLPVDFDTLTEADSMMGSGGMIVMDDQTCVVDIAKYFLDFLIEESCGKCTPCREGLFQLNKMVEKICNGEGTEEDLEKMEKLSEVIITSSLCGLGKSGPNPFISTIKYFRDEYLTHIRDKKCPAKVCRSLIEHVIIDENCDGCTACKPVCSFGAISGSKGKIHKIDKNLCSQCGACKVVCTRDAIEVI